MDRLAFRSFNLPEAVSTALEKEGFKEVSPVQAATIPPLLKKESVLALAPTGTGKTLAYLVPMIASLRQDMHVQGIIISPTVALIDQIKMVAIRLIKDIGSDAEQIKAVKSKDDLTRSDPHIIITTLSLLGQVYSHYRCDSLSYVVIDEGDMITFDGFQENLSSLQSAIDRQIVSFFSASLSIQNIKRVKSMFKIQHVVDVRDDGINTSYISHHLVNMRSTERSKSLSILLDNIRYFKCVIFVSSKSELYKLADHLKKEERNFLLLSGDLDKREIKRVLSDFTKNESDILLASDYASRGLDFPDVDTVISYDLPRDSDYYFHRAGRAGRFYSHGDSYILYSEDDPDSIAQIRAILRRGVDADLYLVTKDSLRLTGEKYVFKNLGKKDQSNDKLQRQIRHAVMRTRSEKVKPGYKKKVRKAVERVKRKHRMKVVRTNITRSGGDAQDYHED